MNVLEIANLLGISEGDVFEDAYESYYGHINEAQIQTDFGRYMKEDFNPPYVNHYLRNHFMEA